MENNAPNSYLKQKFTTTHLAIDLVEFSLGPDAKRKMYNIFLKVKISMPHWEKHRQWAWTSICISAALLTNSGTVI